MKFIIDTPHSDKGNSKQVSQIKLAGQKVFAYTEKSVNPPKSERLGIVKKSGKGKAHGQQPDYILVGDKEVYLQPYTSKNPIFAKKVGWVHVTSDNEEKSGYVKVNKTSAIPIIILILVLLGVLLLVYSALNGVAPKDAPAYFANQTGIVQQPQSTPETTITYATYQSTSDQTWTANSTEQDISLVLPANTTYTDKNGQTKSEKNPIVAAPSIWVDFNGNGKFDNDECVFNPPTYDKNGVVTNPGNLLEAGKELDHVTLTRTIPAGTYKAETVWTPQMAEGGTNANPMAFNWNLTVK